MSKLAEACGVPLRTLQYQCKKHGWNPLEMSLLALARLIEIFNPAVPVASVTEKEKTQVPSQEEGPF